MSQVRALAAEPSDYLKKLTNGDDKAGILKDRVLAARGYSAIFKDTDEVINLDLRVTMKLLPEAM